MTLSAVKHFSKFRWFLFLSFSTVLLIFLFKELSLNSNSSSSFESLLRQLASIVPVYRLGSPANYDALKSLVDLLTGLQSPLSETDLCISRRKPKDDIDSKVANGVQRNLKVTIARTTDTFALDLETSILPKKRKKEKSLKKLELGNVTVAESAEVPKNDQNESLSMKADYLMNEKKLDSGITASSLEPSKESFANHSSSQRDPSLGVNDIDKSLSTGVTTTLLMNSTDLKQSLGVTVGSKMMKAVNPTKINQINLMKSNNIATESIEMIDVSSIKAVDFTEKNTAVNLKSENTTILDNQGIQDPKSVDKQLFYMYDLDEKFWWRWPKPETDCRIRRSRRRTFDPEEASLFIIPYDLGLDGYLDANTCKNTRKCTKGYVEEVQEYVMKYPYFTRNQGKDHAVLWSLGQYHPWPHNNCDTFMKIFCGKCTFTCYWMDPTKEDNRFVSIPFPSGYHWWDGIKDIPWELGPDSNPNSLKRNLTAVYLGSTQTLNPAHTKIRRAMTSQCNASSECHWKQIAHSSTDSNIADLLSIYRKSIFCLCPPGDDPARKGEEASLDISVNIPGGLIRSGKLNFMDVLNGISAETVKLKQIAIAKYAPQIQYSAPPLEYLQNKNDVTPWDPPFKDGVDITLDGMFNRASRSVRNLSTDIPKRIMTSRQWSSEYDVVKVKTPGLPLTVFEVAPSQPGTSHTHTHGEKGEKGGLGHNKYAHQSNHNRPKNGNKGHNTTTT